MTVDLVLQSRIGFKQSEIGSCVVGRGEENIEIKVKNMA